MYKYKMQTESSSLPVVKLNLHKTDNGKLKSDLKNSTLESKKFSPCRNSLPSSNKKCLKPLLGTPYRSSTKQQISDESKSNKSILGQRVMSAKMLRFKQLQNQLADAHYHLNELANENRLLKALQKRQDTALKRYEGTNAELPRLINSHHEELRVLHTKYKKLKELHKDTCNLLKEKENELYSVNSQNKHLLQLSKDRNLEEREKLQLHLSDMNYKMEQQQETVQLLHRKLALETKSLKHQLHTEISKHKETQKNLQETIEKLKNLECLLDNREKRLYYNGQLPIYNKEKNLGSHSLTNLRDTSISNAVGKMSSRSKKSENGIPKNNLPSLDIVEFNNDEKTISTNNINHDQSVNYLKSETMTSLQQIRKFRLQKSANIRKNAHSMDDLRFRSRDSETRMDNNEKIAAVDFKTISERNKLNNEIAKNESGKLRKLFSRMRSQDSLQNELRVEYDYSSDDGQSGNASEHHIGSYPMDIAQKSRELYARLLSSTDDTSDTLDDIMKTANIHSDEEEEEFNTYLAKDLAFQKHKYRSKLKLLHHKGKELYDSSSDVESEEKIDTNENSSTQVNSFPANLSKKQFSKSLNSIHPEHSVLEVRKQSIVEKLKDFELQKISDNDLEAVSTENIEAPQQLPNAKKMWLEEHHLLENKTINFLAQEDKKEDTNEEAKYSENKVIYDTDTSYDKIYHDTFKQNNAYEEIRTLSNLERKEAEENSKQACEKESITNHSNENNHLAYNLRKDYSKTRIEEMPSIIDRSDGEMLNKSNFNIETKNKLNASSEAEDIKIDSTLSNNASQIEQNNEIKDETTNIKQTDDKKRIINYNKEKLLATMKAIDDNENIEFLNQGLKNHSMMNRMQITENLYRGLPTHSRPKRDIIKDIFEDNHIDNKIRGTCSKSH